VLADRLKSDGVSEEAIEGRRGRAQELVAAAVEAAKAAPPAEVSTALTDVWADGGAAWRT
jgi:pyruvate dehydrogenase E1 component alpha subunit